MVSRFPEVLVNRRPALPAIEWPALAPVVTAALEDCLIARRREGATLSAEIVVRLASMESSAARVQALLPKRLDRELTRLRRLRYDLPDDPEEAESTKRQAR